MSVCPFTENVSPEKLASPAKLGNWAPELPPVLPLAGCIAMLLGVTGGISSGGHNDAMLLVPVEPAA